MVHARSRSRAVTAFVMIVLCIGASAAACAEQKRANGDECIKNEECASLICASMKCVAPPPLMEGSGSSSTGTDAGTGGGADTSTGSDSGGAADTSAGDASDDGPPVNQDGSDQDAADALLDVQGDSADAMNDAIADAAEDALDASPGSDGAADGAALSDASDAADAADAFDGMLFDGAIDGSFDANVPDVLGG